MVDVVKRFLGDRLYGKMGTLEVYAASLAFYLIISLVPFLTVFLTLFHTITSFDFSGQIREILNFLLPQEARGMISPVMETLQSASTRGLFTIGFAVAFWSALRFMSTLSRALHYLFEGKQDGVKRTLREWARAMGLFVNWSVTFAVASFLLFFFPALQRWFGVFDFEIPGGVVFIDVCRYLCLFGILGGALYFTYFLFHPYRGDQRVVSFFSLVSAVLMVGVSFGFSELFPYIWASNAVHGSFGTVLVLMFWSYVICWVILVGACGICRFTKERKR